MRPEEAQQNINRFWEVVGSYYVARRLLSRNLSTMECMARKKKEQQEFRADGRENSSLVVLSHGPAGAKRQYSCLTSFPDIQSRCIQFLSRSMTYETKDVCICMYLYVSVRISIEHRNTTIARLYR